MLSYLLDGINRFCYSLNLLARLFHFRSHWWTKNLLLLFPFTGIIDQKIDSDQWIHSLRERNSGVGHWNSCCCPQQRILRRTQNSFFPILPVPTGIFTRGVRNHHRLFHFRSHWCLRRHAELLIKTENGTYSFKQITQGVCVTIPSKNKTPHLARSLLFLRATTTPSSLPSYSRKLCTGTLIPAPH